MCEVALILKDLNTSPEPSLVSKLLVNSRHANAIQLFFLIGHLNLIGVWLGEVQRANTIKSHHDV